MSKYKNYNDLVKTRFNSLVENIDQNRLTLELFRAEAIKKSNRLQKLGQHDKSYEAFSSVYGKNEFDNKEQRVKFNASMELMSIQFMMKHYAHEAQEALDSNGGEYTPLHFDEIKPRSSLVQCQVLKAA